MKRIAYWVCLLYCLGACMDPPIDSKLKLINTSNRAMLVVYTVDDRSYQAINGLPDYNPFQEIQQADTTRGYQAGLLKDNPKYIAPNDTISAHLGMGKWEAHIGQGKLFVYVFNPQTVLNTSWEAIRLGKKWDHVYSFTLDQVEAMDWAIRLPASH